ncbi:MAG: type II toxin-antitoxin system RelE/ParE family toxin [Lachnospiraceae bacterium]|nr:type II toxin-antitoxin system RelE/ParE family toxin [Lachnospiraceae bacterium]
MLNNIQLADEALDDLFDFSSYIFRSTYSLDYSINVYNVFYEAISSISIFPHGFKDTHINYRNYNIYLLPYDIYNVFYIFDDDTITVLRVLHQKRNWQRIINKHNYYHIDNNIL